MKLQINNRVDRDARKSVVTFRKFTTLAIKAHFGDDATIHSYEDSENPDERKRDLYNAIDGIVIDSEGWTHNFASRVTFKPQYQNFTVRGYRPSGTKTEIDKIGQVDEPKPEISIQTCVDERGAVVAIAETVELYRFIERYKPAMRFNHYDGVGFYPVPFASLASVRVFYVDASGNVTNITATFTAA